MGGQNKNKANSISTEIALTELGNEKLPQLCGDTIRTSVCTSWKSVEGGIVLMKFKINIYVDIYFFNGGI